MRNHHHHLCLYRAASRGQWQCTACSHTSTTITITISTATSHARLGPTEATLFGSTVCIILRLFFFSTAFTCHGPRPAQHHWPAVSLCAMHAPHPLPRHLLSYPRNSHTHSHS